MALLDVLTWRLFLWTLRPSPRASRWDPRMPEVQLHALRAAEQGDDVAVCAPTGSAQVEGTGTLLF